MRNEKNPTKIRLNGDSDLGRFLDRVSAGRDKDFREGRFLRHRGRNYLVTRAKALEDTSDDFARLDYYSLAEAIAATELFGPWFDDEGEYYGTADFNGYAWAYQFSRRYRNSRYEGEGIEEEIAKHQSWGEAVAAAAGKQVAK